MPSGSASPMLATASCVPTAGITGTTLTMLIPNSAQFRAAAAVVASKLAIAGVRVRIVAPAAARYASLARLGGWDLLLANRPLRYPSPRGLLAPMLDAAWPGADAMALRRPPLLFTQLMTANSERQREASLNGWAAFDVTLSNAAIIVPLAQLSTVYPRGENVEQAPISPTFSNADPANVALGSTRPGDPARSPTATP